MTPRGIDHFNETDGLAGDDLTAMAFLLDPDGSVWLGSSGGATHVFAQFYDGPPAAPRTALLAGKLGDRSILDAQAALEVPHDRNALTIELASSSLLDHSRIGYQVRLSPIETEWSASRTRDARYPSLPPGVYRFEARARIGAGGWGPTVAASFAVLPAWWQTRWFLALSGIASALAVGAAVARWMRRRTRQLHARSDTSFRAVIDLMPDMISIYRDRKLIYLNLAHRRFLGIEGAETWADLVLIERVHPDDRAAVMELFHRVRNHETRPGDAIEIRMCAADGSWRICEVAGILVEIAGAPTVVASGRDVTERKRMRAKLLVSDRMASLGTLAAGIAHEINNPLAYVTGNLEALAETFQSTGGAGAIASSEHAEVAAAISDARDGAERVRKIVQGLRVFSRSDDEQRAPLALTGVLEAAIRMTGNQLRHRARLVRDLGPVPPVVGDDGRLTQVFINLLVNAAHAIPEGHFDQNCITVRTRTDDHGRATIEIEDTGKGIAADVQSRVFDPFFTTKDVGQGTGLGLSICHGIISGIGGLISIESSTDPDRPVGRLAGAGTIVRVVLPPAPELLAPRPVAPSEPSLDKAGQRRHRVLLVDDEPQVAQTMERLLRRDYDVTIATCGHDAIDHIAQGKRFDAIVSDVMMPNMTGIELFDQLQRVAPDQAKRLIFLSGGAFTAQTSERLGELSVLQLEKPITAKELRACVLRIANEAQS